MTFSIDNPRGVATTPLGKYVWEKPSGEQGIMYMYGETLDFQCEHHQYGNIKIPNRKINFCSTFAVYRC